MRYYTPWFMVIIAGLSMAFPNPEQYSFVPLFIGFFLGLLIDLLEATP